MRLLAVHTLISTGLSSNNVFRLATASDKDVMSTSIVTITYLDFSLLLTLCKFLQLGRGTGYISANFSRYH